MHTPTPDESALSWLRMLIVCWDVHVKNNIYNGKAHGASKTLTHVGNNSCGHGYSPGDAVKYHHPVIDSYLIRGGGGSALGGTPSEYTHRYQSSRR